MFELCVEYGYHPDRQVPMRDGNYGTPLVRCLQSEKVVRFLLEHGANPNISDFLDHRCKGWGERSTPPMDRMSGLALDLAVKNYFTEFPIIEMLLKHGANPSYSRPILNTVYRWSHQRGAAKQRPADWRPIMELLFRYGADVNAVEYYSGTALSQAVIAQLWDVVEFLLENGADPRIKQPRTGKDGFELAAEEAGIAWDERKSKGEYVNYLCDLDSGTKTEDEPSAPEYIYQNPLVRVLQKIKGVKTEELDDVVTAAVTPVS